MDDQRGIIEKTQPVVSNDRDQKGSESSSSSTVAVNEAVVPKSVIMVRSDSSKQLTDESISIDDDNKKAKGVLDGNLVGKEELNDKRVVSSCAIDVKLGDDDDDGGREMVCRICHLSSDQSPERGVTSVDGKMKEKSILVQLGCGCKDELGVAHTHCAEAWFKLKGNRICEICGEGARNIRGIIHEQMGVEWNDRGSYASYSPERHGVWWRGQPCCNFLLACLIVAFVLPWFFRVKIV
ncbi:hypothetical protein L6452_30905 [Arctium lappa]|uniref:Uncharacterized protein n=1 Tax=Arctium lappa TaxID=4217 RepID=A0ACB8ZJP3_ARCLA|nr:hypothetical protein L6452_30905 [Arctium lappa]